MQTLETPIQCQLERLEHAADHFSQIMNFWNDRLTFKGSSYWEQYHDGRMALVLDCVVSTCQIKRHGAIRLAVDNGDGIANYLNAFIILKADCVKGHKLQCWDDELMFVHDVQFVEGPEGIIPSRIGLYRIFDKVRDDRSSLLFQSTIHNFFKFLGTTDDWELCMAGEFARNGQNCLSKEDVEGTSQIVNCIPKNLRRQVLRELGLIDVNPQAMAPKVILHPEAVEIRLPKILDKFIQIRDVLVGPFNLDPCRKRRKV